jgi:hypothetical protein
MSPEMLIDDPNAVGGVVSSPSASGAPADVKVTSSSVIEVTPAGIGPKTVLPVTIVDVA